MARRGSRKVTPLLVADSCAIARSLREAVTVLRRWHPTLTPLIVIESQLPLVEQAFESLDVVIPAEPEPAGMFTEKA